MDKRYDIKFFINNTNILVFRAFLVNATSYRLISIEGFGVNENYKNLFLRIIQGKLRVKYFDKSTFVEKEKATPQYVEINENSAIENIQKAETLDNQLVGITMKSEEIQLEPMLSFRYEGHSLNLADGLLPKNANKVSNITTKLISKICANNTDFGEVYQMESYAGSTVIPFEAERIDKSVIEILIKIINDINKGKADIKYIQANENFSLLYKKIIKTLQELPSIKGLEKFQIIIKGEEYTISNLKLLDRLDMYSQALNGKAKVRYYEGQLKSRKNRYVIVVEEDSKDVRLHFDTQDNNFQSILKNAKNLICGTHISYKGYIESEEVILINELIIV